MAGAGRSPIDDGRGRRGVPAARQGARPRARPVLRRARAGDAGAVRRRRPRPGRPARGGGTGRGDSPPLPSRRIRRCGRPRRPISSRPGCAMRSLPTAASSSGSAPTRRRSICSAPVMSGSTSCWRSRRLPFAVTWIDPRAGAFPVPRAGERDLPRRQRAGAPARAGARRRLRRHHDPQPRPRSRRRGGGAEGAALSLCRPDRQRHQARPLREHAAPDRARAARTSTG